MFGQQVSVKCVSNILMLWLKSVLLVSLLKGETVMPTALSIGLKILAENNGSKEIEVVIPAINSRAPVVVEDDKSKTDKMNIIKESVVSQFNVWLENDEHKIDDLEDKGAPVYAESPVFKDVDLWMMNDLNINEDKEKAPSVLRSFYSAGDNVFQASWIGDAWTNLPAPSYGGGHNDKVSNSDQVIEDIVMSDHETYMINEKMKGDYINSTSQERNRHQELLNWFEKHEGHFGQY